jgi:putative transposase
VKHPAFRRIDNRSPLVFPAVKQYPYGLRLTQLGAFGYTWGMNAPKRDALDYINYLVASPRVVSGTEATRVPPAQPDPPAHDAFTRLLDRLEPDSATLWAEAEPQLRREAGVLVLDDSTLDKPYARKMGLLTRHWSGKHRRVVQGLNRLTLLWIDGDALIPCDYRRYEKSVDGLSKTDHFRAMLDTAKARGFSPECVVFDSWYASLANLKAIPGHGWRWVTQLKVNRLVNPDGTGNSPLGDCAIAEGGTRVHLQGDGFILVFLIVHPDGDKEYWATSDPWLGELTRLKYAEWAWGASRSTIAASSSIAASSAPRCAPPAPSATTSAAPSGAI